MRNHHGVRGRFIYLAGGGLYFRLHGASLAVIAPLRLYSCRRNKFLAFCLYRILKIVAILLALVLSTIPLAGVFLLIPKVLYYLTMRKAFLASPSRS